MSFLKETPSMMKRVVAAKFEIPPSTLSPIMKNKDIIQQNFENGSKTMKKNHACFFLDADKYVRKWFEQYYGGGVSISNLMLQKKLKTLLKDSNLMVSKQVMVNLKSLK